MIFTPTQKIERNSINIPRELRAALGFVNNKSLFYSLTQNDRTNLSNEIILTTINFDHWKYIWELSIQFKDRQGLISELSALLKAQHIDIINCRVSLGEQGTKLKAKFVINAQNYASFYDSDSNKRYSNRIIELEELESLIIATFIEDIEFSNSVNSKPLISLKRNIPLIRSSENTIIRGAAELTNSEIKLSKDIFDNIFASFLRIYPNLSTQNGVGRAPLCCMTAEHNDSLIRVIVFYKNTGYLHFRVKCKDILGTISILTEILWARRLNIVQMNLRNLKDNYSLIDFLIQFSSEIDTKKNDAELRRYIKNSLVRKTMVEKLDIEFIKPNFYEPK